MDDINLLEKQIVGPNNADFYATRFRESPATICTARINLQEPCLDLAKMRKLKLYASPCMSLFGIYIHLPTGLLIVHCSNRESFSIRKTRWEIQDVINRTDRNKIWIRGKAIPGFHYIELGEIPMGNHTTSCIGWEEVMADIEKQRIRLKIRIPEEVESDILENYNHIIPLLPVYIGHRTALVQDSQSRLVENRVKAVDFSMKDYTDQLDDFLGSLVMYQNVYSIVERLQVVVEMGKNLPAVDFAIRGYLKQGLGSKDAAQYVANWYNNAAKHGIINNDQDDDGDDGDDDGDDDDDMNDNNNNGNNSNTNDHGSQPIDLDMYYRTLK